MAESRGLQKTIYTTGRKSHSSLGFAHTRFSQTFNLGLPVMVVAALLFPCFREYPRHVQPLRLPSIFPPGQSKLPLAPRHLLGVSQTDVLLQESAKHQQLWEGRDSPLPPPCGEKTPAFSPLYYFLGSFLLLYVWDESVQTISDH